MTAKKVYKSKKDGTSLLSTLINDLESPKMTVKFCSLVTPYQYKNSPSVPRYSITCILCPEKDAAFLEMLHTIEKNNGVETILKNDTIKKNGDYILTGKVVIKFQSKNFIPVFWANPDDTYSPTTLHDEIDAGEEVSVIFDILKYTKRNALDSSEYGMSFMPTKIIFYPKEEDFGDS
jgi:hypothetical protein